jgi:hypothetical protein
MNRKGTGVAANRRSGVFDCGGVFEVSCGGRDIGETVLHRLRVVRVHLVEGSHRGVVLVEPRTKVLADFGDGALNGVEVFLDVHLKVADLSLEC